MIKKITNSPNNQLQFFDLNQHTKHIQVKLKYTQKGTLV
jgi:hypothetical protein